MLPEEDILVKNPVVWDKLMAMATKDKTAEEMQHVDVFEQVSTLTRLVRIFRTWLRILHFCRKGTLVARNYYGWQEGFKVVVLWHQRQTFSAERASLEQGVKPPGAMFERIDIKVEQGLMLAGGRLRGMLLPIVHKDSKLARLWLRYLHEVELLHVGGRGTLWGESCRQIYMWQGSNLAKKIVKECIPCRRQKCRKFRRGNKRWRLCPQCAWQT